MKKKTKKLASFSLAEILIVLAIIGILIMLVLPNQTGVATKTKSLEAQQELKMIYSLENTYYLQYSKYSSNFSELDYIPHKNSNQGGTANYEIVILEATSQGFKARAIAVNDFNGNGIKNTWDIDQNGIIKETQKD